MRKKVSNESECETVPLYFGTITWILRGWNTNENYQHISEYMLWTLQKWKVRSVIKWIHKRKWKQSNNEFWSTSVFQVNDFAKYFQASSRFEPKVPSELMSPNYFEKD